MWSSTFLDEIGYLSYDAHAADLLFQVISRRYEQRSIVVTTNVLFKPWDTVFPNASCAVALIDRLTHHAETIPIEGDSYREREAELTQKTRRAAPPSVDHRSKVLRFFKVGNRSATHSSNWARMATLCGVRPLAATSVNCARSAAGRQTQRRGMNMPATVPNPQTEVQEIHVLAFRAHETRSRAPGSRPPPPPRLQRT